MCHVIVDLILNGKIIPFKVDNCALVTVMPEVIFQNCFKNIKLKKEKVNLSLVNGESILVVVQIIVNVNSSNNEIIELPLIVTENCI